MKVEVVGKEIIKPSSPTPPHLKIFKLSQCDQGNPLTYIAFVLFYTNDEDNNVNGASGSNISCEKKNFERSKTLKESLSQVLTLLYPFVGRIKDNISIECNDEGIEYSEAQVDCSLQELLAQPTCVKELLLLNPPLELMNKDIDPLLLVQDNTFVCGGTALGLKVCHKIADGAMVATIIKAWSNTAIGMPNAVIPDLSIANLYPPNELSSESLSRMQIDTGIAKIILFKEAKINALKAKVMGVQDPTRVEVILALLWRCAIRASIKLRMDDAMPSVLIGAVNMRAYLKPSLSTYSCGNALGLMFVEVNEGEIDFSDFIHRLRKTIAECRGLSARENNGSSMFSIKNRYVFSSWCRFPFYEADFGWGKLIWMCVGPVYAIGFGFLEARDGFGIEAYVKLREQDMTLFEQDEELLAFGSINPSILLN